MTQEERASYADRLARRTVATVSEESPPGLGLSSTFWETVEPVNQILLDALDAYERGEIDKGELDSKAVGYLRTWREGVQAWKTRS